MASKDWAAPNLPVTSPNQGTTTKPTSLDPRLQKELSRLDASVPFNPRTGFLHHTWAQTFYSRPEFFLQPESVPELTKIITLARRLGKRVCVTGFGHSPSDLTLTSSWLINLDNLSRILEWDVGGQSGLVRFEAGISLHSLNQRLAEKGHTLPNLGSIDVQSVAGSIATGTHGSSLKHGLLSQSIVSLKIMLANSKIVEASAEKNPELFRAALVSLGSLGIVTEIVFQATNDFNISWSQKLFTLEHVLSTWDTTLWTQQEYTRVWWLPYLKRAVIWSASRTNEAVRPPRKTFYGGKFGYYLYHNLLALSNYFPRILPTVEWLIFGMQYGFKPGSFEMTAVQPVREGLLMDCLYSQFVNEWAIPHSKGPEAIRRLSAWINGDEKTARIPFSSEGLWVHSPIEVRVSDTNTDSNKSGVRPYLDPTRDDGPTLYLNATLYRPYGKDPPCRARYYEAFEWLMRDLRGRPHWAKCFETEVPYIENVYADNMKDFMKVRDEVDPDGLFVGEWHRRNLPIRDSVGTEVEETRRKMGRGWGDGMLWIGRQLDMSAQREDEEDGQKTPSPPLTSTSEESFDYMAKGEASVYDKMQEMGG